MDPRKLAARVRDRDRSAVAEALNWIDPRRPRDRAQVLELLALLARDGQSDAACLGLTGAPGAGKSTLLDALVRELRGREQTVGIVAVDPSSRQSGGALLADRIRVRSGTGDPGVFFRSMAARDRLGGLAAATRSGIAILAAAYDWVVVETVGVGQSEGEVADLVDTLVYVAQPGAGDMLQYMKAGVLELPDIFVVNKADLGEPAERTANELRAGLEFGTERSAWKPSVLLASATQGEGIGAWVDVIESHRAAVSQAERADRRRRGSERFVLSELAARYGHHGLEAVGGIEALNQQLAEEPSASEFESIERWSRRIEAAWIKGALAQS